MANVKLRLVAPHDPANEVIVDGVNLAACCYRAEIVTDAQECAKVVLYCRAQDLVFEGEAEVEVRQADPAT